MTAGCTASLRGRILHLTLDTRGSSVNVFTPAIALELERELRTGLAAGAQAVVLESGKPGSFVNGVGLLLAASSHARAAAMERARVLRRSYDALASAPVPTIAAVAGNCYGCGLELALTCDYRIASDSYDTHFYMPEVRDYAFVPLFGGTQRLPLLVGLRAGMDILLGERVDARRAARLGLVDWIAPPAGMEGALQAFLSGLRKRGWPKRQSRRASRTGSPSLASMPGPERELARECLRLARMPFSRGYRMDRALQDELESFWRSLTPQSERAMSFFFVRQAAKAHAIGSAAYERPRNLTLSVSQDNPQLEKLARLLEARRLPGIEITARGTLAFSEAPVPGAFTCVLGSSRPGGDCRAILPLPDEPVPVIELVPATPERPWRKGAALFQLLEHAGFAPVVTRATGAFVTERLIAAFRAAAGSAPARRGLLEFGYRLPAALARGLRGGGSASGIGERVTRAIAAECIQALDEGTLTHPTQAELLAHVLFGFPPTRGGVLRYAAKGRSALARDAARVVGHTGR